MAENGWQDSRQVITECLFIFLKFRFLLPSRADQAEVSGKQKVEIDGNDYYLQTEDELSIDETDQKSGGGNDSDVCSLNNHSILVLYSLFL